MANGKKSFIFYCEWQETFNELSDENAGQLIKHIFAYVNDLNPKTDNELVRLCFIPIKQSLKRDLVKYQSYIDKQRENGAKGGRPKKTQKTQPFILKPKKADSVNDNDSVNIKRKRKPFTPPTVQQIKDYAKERGHRVDANKIYEYYSVANWHDAKGNKIKNWKQKINGIWFKPENKIQKQAPANSQYTPNPYDR